jgi:hypothetical protein
MKKAIALTLAVVFFLCAFLWLPRASFAHADHCYDDWQTCRQRAFEADEGVVRTTLMLTVCDIAWGKCQIFGN